MSVCGKCGHAHRFTDLCGYPAQVWFGRTQHVCECRGEAAAQDRAELHGVVRAAIGYEYGRQIGAGYSEPDLGGLANAVVAALNL